MFKRDRVDESILEEMANNYYKNAFERTKTNQDHVKIMEHLNSAAELLEGKALYKEAEFVTWLIEVVAKKKTEKDKEDKKKAKKSKKDKEDKKEGKSPKSSEEAVKNLKTKGWMFSADDGKAASVVVTAEGDSDDDDFNDLSKLWEQHLIYLKII